MIRLIQDNYYGCSERIDMYYEEKIIKGILHSRSTPNGEWVAMTPKELTDLLTDTRKLHAISLRDPKIFEYSSVLND